MIIRAFIVFLVLFGIFNAKLWRSQPKGVWGQNQWQNNIIKAQNYIYAIQAPDTVVVGSSMSATLDGTVFPESSLYNLSFRAGCARQGLEIIARSSPKPKCVLVEVNKIFLPNLDKNFVPNLFTPIFYEMRKAFPAMREQNQPITLLSGIALPPLANMVSTFVASKSARNPSGNSLAAHQALNALIRQHRSARLHAPHTLLAPLKQHIYALQQQGVRIVFFETPMHPALCQSMYYEDIRAELRRVFPPEKFIYLPRPDCALYRSTDGLHLTTADTRRYCLWLAYQIQNMR